MGCTQRVAVSFTNVSHFIEQNTSIDDCAVQCKMVACKGFDFITQGTNVDWSGECYLQLHQTMQDNNNECVQLFTKVHYSGP